MTSTSLHRAFEAAATGRIVWGALALLAPGLNLRVAGVGDRDTPEMRYLIRVFGARAAALGLGYLLADEDERRRWRRICLFVDTTDTAHGAAHVIRGDIRRGSAAALTAATGTYATLGLIGLMSDRKAGISWRGGRPGPA